VLIPFYTFFGYYLSLLVLLCLSLLCVCFSYIHYSSLSYHPPPNNNIVSITRNYCNNVKFVLCCCRCCCFFVFVFLFVWFCFCVGILHIYLIKNVMYELRSMKTRYSENILNKQWWLIIYLHQQNEKSPLTCKQVYTIKYTFASENKASTWDRHNKLTRLS